MNTNDEKKPAAPDAGPTKTNLIDCPGQKSNFAETYFNGVVDTIGMVAFFDDENEEDGRPGIFVLSTEDDVRSVIPNYFGQKVFLVPEQVLTELAAARAALAKEQSYANDLIMDVAAEKAKVVAAVMLMEEQLDLDEGFTIEGKITAFLAELKGQKL